MYYLLNLKFDICSTVEYFSFFVNSSKMCGIMFQSQQTLYSPFIRHSTCLIGKTSCWINKNKVERKTSEARHAVTYKNDETTVNASSTW